MSVIYFTNKELSEIYENLAHIATRVDSILDISEEKLKQFMVRVGLCNRLAYKFTYLNGKTNVKLDIPNLEMADFVKMTLKHLIEKLSLLEYNCITNSGKCFLDKKDKELLGGMLDSLKWRYIKKLEWKLKK